jgi:hemerythrin
VPTRLPRGSSLTTAEAAAVLKVSVATLKRWTQSGLLPSERTSGGHRRFRAEDVQALAAPLATPDDPVLLGADQLLHAGSPLSLQAWLLDARRTLGSWWAVAQPLRGVVDELLRRRAAGLLGAVPLEAALDRLRCALLHFAEGQVPPPGARPALITAVPGDPFLSTPALLQLCLPESGWSAEWGGHPSVEDLEEELHRRPVEAVVVTASRGVERDVAHRHLAGLAAAAARLGAPVVMVGAGEPALEGPVVRLPTAELVAGWLEDLARRANGGDPLAHGLSWEPSLALGNEVVDQQHQMLFSHARHFLDLVQRGQVEDGGRETLAFISDYARLHFSFEEDLMRASGYPALAEHLREHELFALRLEALAREVAAAPGPEPLLRLARFLATWLREHVAGSDQRIGEHLRATGFAGGGAAGV